MSQHPRRGWARLLTKGTELQMNGGVLSAHLAMLPGTWQGRPTCWESGETEQALFRPAGC